MSVRSDYLGGPQHSCIHRTSIQLFIAHPSYTVTIIALTGQISFHKKL